MSEWRPMKTAPFDGTHVLLGGGIWEDDASQPQNCVMVAWWDTDGFWNTCSAEAGYSKFPYKNPRGWMPVPQYIE